jgi:hypothetical protein
LQSISVRSTAIRDMSCCQSPCGSK